MLVQDRRSAYSVQCVLLDVKMGAVFNHPLDDNEAGRLKNIIAPGPGSSPIYFVIFLKHFGHASFNL